MSPVEWFVFHWTAGNVSNKVVLLERFLERVQSGVKETQKKTLQEAEWATYV